MKGLSSGISGFGSSRIAEEDRENQAPSWLWVTKTRHLPVRHSREGGNPVKDVWSADIPLDSRLRGKDGGRMLASDEAHSRMPIPL